MWVVHLTIKDHNNKSLLITHFMCWCVVKNLLTHSLPDAADALDLKAIDWACLYSVQSMVTVDSISSGTDMYINSLATLSVHYSWIQTVLKHCHVQCSYKKKPVSFSTACSTPPFSSPCFKFQSSLFRQRQHYISLQAAYLKNSWDFIWCQIVFTQIHTLYSETERTYTFYYTKLCFTAAATATMPT